MSWITKNPKVEEHVCLTPDPHSAGVGSRWVCDGRVGKPSLKVREGCGKTYQIIQNAIGDQMWKEEI